MKANGRENGHILIDLLMAVGLLVLGFLFSDRLIQWTGLVKFIAAVPYLITLVLIALTPLYTLHKKLDDLKSIAELSNSEQGRFDHVVAIKVRFLIRMVAFYILVAVFMISARVWPEGSPLSLLLSKVTCGLVLVTLYFIGKTLQGFMEVFHFETTLKTRARKARQKKELLKAMSEKNS